MSINKILLGRTSQQRYTHDRSLDASFTSNIGFVQPTFCREMVPENTYKVQVNSKVYATPLNSYCFGRLALRHYHSFVPMTDLYKHYDNLLAGTDVKVAGNSFIPTVVPFITGHDVLGIIMAQNFTSGGEIAIMDDNSTDLDINAISNVVYEEFGIRPIITSNEVTTYQNGYDHFDLRFQTSSYTYGISFSRQQKNVVSILRALGYSWSLKAPQQTLLKLLAYYKAYYDLFAPQRNSTWENTSCYSIIAEAYNSNGKSAPQYSSWFNFVRDELCTTFYTINPDYFTASVTQFDNRTNYITQYDGGTQSSVTSHTGGITASNDLSETGGANQLSLINRMLRLVNKNTVLGKSVKDYLNTHFGSSGDLVVPESNYIGSSSVNVNIGDILQSANTDGGDDTVLGYRSGVVNGADGSQSFSFTSKKFGYWITLVTLVPIDSCYTQGYLEENLHIRKFDYFTPEFDAIGYTPVQVGELLSNTTDVSDDTQNEAQSFGLLPRYSSYKTNPQGLLNGDFALMSLANTYDSYMLYRKFTTGQLEYDGSFTPSPIARQVTTGLRYIGRFDDYGNYNRIFFDPDSLYDHFMIHEVYNVKSTFAGLPMSKSFDTDANDDAIKVEHV